MPLLNYTTTVSENKTASEIEKILAAHKAKGVSLTQLYERT